MATTGGNTEFPGFAVGSENRPFRLGFAPAFSAISLKRFEFELLGEPTIMPVHAEAGDQDALKQAMSGYFASVPSARSEIRSIYQSGSFVFALEQAFWTSKEVEKSQCSMAVYELVDGMIKHVWYFPAHACS